MAEVSLDSGPTIKGIFVLSHVAAVRAKLGEDGVGRLAKAFGQPVAFRNGEDVPVRDEVRLIECALDLLHPGVPAEERAFEAGRLHFRNFRGTPWAKLIFGMFSQNFRFMILHAGSIAERVFRGVEFEAEELGPETVRVTISGNDYPIEHFRGLFWEWMHGFGLHGSVVAQETGPGRYEYLCQWRPAEA